MELIGAMSSNVVSNRCCFMKEEIKITEPMLDLEMLRLAFPEYDLAIEFLVFAV